MVRSNSILLGENCLIYERIKDQYGKDRDYERVIPNFFNPFFDKTQLIADEENDDPDDKNSLE